MTTRAPGAQEQVVIHEMERERARDVGERPGPVDGGQVLAIGIFFAASTAGLGMRISRIPSL